MSKRMNRLVAGIAGTSLAATALVGVVGTPSWGATESDEFEYTETGSVADSQSFTVPAGITEVGITAVGAGAAGVSGASGGSGAVVSSRQTVVPGDLLEVRVGGGGRAPQAGGSATAVLRGATNLVIAGGGGAAKSDALGGCGAAGGTGAAASTAAGGNGVNAVPGGFGHPGGGGNADQVTGNGGSGHGTGGGAGGTVSFHDGANGVADVGSDRAGGGGFGDGGNGGSSNDSTAFTGIAGLSGDWSHQTVANGGGGGAGSGGGGGGTDSDGGGGGGGGFGGGGGGARCGGAGAGGSYAEAVPVGALDPQFAPGPYDDGFITRGAGVEGLIAGDGWVQISWNPPAPPSADSPSEPGLSPGLVAQTPATACVVAPVKLARKGKKTVLRNPCVTTAGQAVTVRVSGKKGSKAKPKYRVVKAAGGGKAIRTYGRKFSLTVTWSAPATGTAAAYLKQTDYRR